MAIYEYRCRTCGHFDVARPMGAAPSTCECVHCGAASARSYSAPLVNRTPRPLAEALTSAEKSRDEPEVVTAIPPARRSAGSRHAHPRVRGLPKW